MIAAELMLSKISSSNLSRFDLRILTMIGTVDVNISSIELDSFEINGKGHLKGSMKHYIPIVETERVCISSAINIIGYSNNIPFQISMKLSTVKRLMNGGKYQSKSLIFFKIGYLRILVLFCGLISAESLGLNSYKSFFA
jgi:hypothetical protein